MLELIFNTCVSNVRQNGLLARGKVITLNHIQNDYFIVWIVIFKMQMKFSKCCKREAANSFNLKGRTGHRVIRVNRSIFVMGGRSEEGLWEPEVNRINCQNKRIDSLILDNTLYLQEFALFCFQESLFVWGGRSLDEYSDQLFQFDGSRFTPLKQTGEIPKPRANHCYTTFGGKYLIIFGGQSHQQFFNDWCLLNIKTYEWYRLNPSMDLNFSSGSRMVWLNGRGFLLLNEAFDQELNFYHYNLFFQFHITDFQQKKVRIIPLNFKFDLLVNSVILTHMVSFNQQYLLIFGGYHNDNITKTHDKCFLIDVENSSAQTFNLDIHGVGFQAIFQKETLYILGGQSKVGNTSGMCYYQCFETQQQARRHVCWGCKMYFDQQWLINSNETYQRYRLKEDVDYNYSMKLDNNLLQRLSNYITHQFYALTLLIQTLKQLNSQQIDIHFSRVPYPYKNLQIGDHHLQYLKLTSNISSQLLFPLINQIKMQNIFGQNQMLDCQNLSMIALELKLATFRMAKSTIMVFKLNQETIYVLYYSSCPLQCGNSNFNTFSHHSYKYSPRDNQCCSPLNRHIIYQNMKHIFKVKEQYEQLGDANFALFSICGDIFQTDLILHEQNIDLQTGESCLVGSIKQESKRTVPLIQLSFLPNYKLPSIIIQQIHLNLFNLQDMIENDKNNTILKSIQVNLKEVDRKGRLFQKINLCYFPEQYWFRQVLVYHQGRLISRFNLAQKQICGIIQLNPTAALDLSRTNLQNLSDRLVLQRTLESLTSYKRWHSG